jgi:hypothetical protein
LLQETGRIEARCKREGGERKRERRKRKREGGE